MQSAAHHAACALTLTAALLGSAGCSSSNSDGPTGTGGSATTGGTTGSGGSATTAGSGGSPVASGGQVGASGASTAGSSAGGQTGSGGSAVGGQTGAGGSTGGSSAGSGSGGGSGGGAPTGAAPSAGCGKPTELKSGTATIDVGGKMRQYILALPENYDQGKPYKLIFGWHPWGGSAQQVASGGYYGLQSQAKGEAIFVAGEGLPFGGDSKGWGNENGQDIAMLNAMLERFRTQLCVDENRIFSTGFSFGGMFSFAAGCSAMGMMRAIAPMAGNTMVAGCESGSRPVAVMGFHGIQDSVVSIDGGRAGRDAFVKRNGCMSQSMPAESKWCEGAGQNYQPCTCVSYPGCQEGYPVTWCEFTGDHMPAPNSAATIWSFFSQF